MAHPLPARLKPLIALVLLLGLTALSYGVSRLHLGDLAAVVALGIAVIKASLVAVIFMEITHTASVPRVVGGATIFFIVLLCLGIAADVGYR